MRIQIALVLCLLAPAIHAAQNQVPAADQPATDADVERYFEAAHVRDTTQRTLAAMTAQMQQIVHNQVLDTPGLPAGAEQKIEKHLELMNKNMASVQDEMLKVMVAVYEKHYTKGDIDAMIAFYSSPTGQKMIQEQPAITAESLQASSGIIKKLMDEARQQISDDIDEMRQNSPPPAMIGRK
jgi:uncharacterized protein